MNNEAYWLLGHRITPVQFSDNLDMIIIDTPPQADGPPLHYHAQCEEFFMVLAGEMEYMVGEEKGTKGPGEFMVVPRNTVHTFSNRSDQPLKTLNIHTPKGFAGFMQSMGTITTQKGARQASLSEEAIQKFVQAAADNDMHIVSVNETAPSE